MAPRCRGNLPVMPDYLGHDIQTANRYLAAAIAPVFEGNWGAHAKNIADHVQALAFAVAREQVAFHEARPVDIEAHAVADRIIASQRDVIAQLDLDKNRLQCELARLVAEIDKYRAQAVELHRQLKIANDELVELKETNAKLSAQRGADVRSLGLARDEADRCRHNWKLDEERAEKATERAKKAEKMLLKIHDAHREACRLGVDIGSVSRLVAILDEIKVTP
jgi:chromosome segregation ATPase